MLRTLMVAALLATGVIRAQHDPGRNAVRELARGDYAKAATTLEKTRGRNSPVDQAEKHVVRMLSACLQDDGVTALKEAKLAVANGAQFGRFVAGPQTVLAPLYQAPGYAEWAATLNSSLVHGPMIGAVTADSARVWLRTARPMTVTVALSNGADSRSEQAATLNKRDNTAVVDFAGLKPKTDYKVSVLVNDLVVGEGSFRTPAPRGQADKFAVVFGGGAGYTPQYERMWQTIEGQKPDLLLMLGDNVYIDDPTHTLTNHYCYYRRQSQPEWRSLVAKTPTYAIYDDHDFGLNDCVPGPFIDEPSWKRPVWEIFRNNWANPSYGGGDKQPGCWFDFYRGDVHFIFLDCRFYRNLTGGTMLGPVQMAWLKQTLKESKGTFKVLASSVPWSAGVKPGSRDTWDGFRDEREEIFGFCEANKLDGVVLISADRHRVDVRKTPRPAGYDLYEFMSSRLTNVHTHSLVDDSKGSEFLVGYNKTPAFAKLEFDTTVKPATLVCHIYDIDNTLHHTVKLDHGQLRHK